MYYLSVANEIAETFISKDDRRVICTLEGKEKFHCAFMPKGGGGWFILVNQKIRNKLGLVQGQVVTVELEKDTTEYGLPMTEEFRELLAQDEDGDKFFHALTPGKQRNLIYIAGNVKSPHIRMRRAIVIVEHLKGQKGKLDFKKLYEELKEANQREKR